MKVGPYHYISHFQQLPPSRNHPEIQERPLRLQEDVLETLTRNSVNMPLGALSPK